MRALAIASPNAAAQQLIGRDYISYSRISTYQQCPLKFYFRYVAELPEPVVTASLVFGGAIHASVEHHFRELLSGSSSPAVPELMQVYRAVWQERADRDVKFGKNENQASLDSTAERMLAAFLASAVAWPAGTIIGVEEQLRGPLMANLPDLLARIDLMVDTGDQLVVTDLKTSRSRWGQGHADRAAEQILLYGELIRDLIPRRRLVLQFAVITKGKEPAVESHALNVNSRRVARTRRIVERVWRAIESQHFYPAPSPMNCPGCPYRKPCRAWRG